MTSKIEKAIADLYRTMTCEHDWKETRKDDVLKRTCKICKAYEIHLERAVTCGALRANQYAALKPAKKRAHQRRSRPSVRLNPKKSLSR